MGPSGLMPVLASQGLRAGGRLALFFLLRRFGLELGGCVVFRCGCGFRFCASPGDYWRFVGPRHFESLTMAFLLRRVRRGDVVLDVGAHIGIYTVHLAKRAGLVFAVEPEPRNLELLLKNVKLNGLRNVVVLPVAACEYDGESVLYLHSSSGGHSLAVPGPVGIRVRCRRLGSLLRELGVGRVDAVKIDVEGYEEKVLEGLRELLSSSPPHTLVVEMDRDLPLVPLLEGFGYRRWVVLDRWNGRVNVAFIR